MLDDHGLAALVLTSRLVESPAKPLSAREFWELSRTAEPAALRGKAAIEIATRLAVSGDHAARIAALLDRGAGLALAVEQLDHAGIWTITPTSEHYPERLRTRLGGAAPVVLHGVGDLALLDADGVGIVGSRDISDEGSDVARKIADAAVLAGLPVVSGAARGVDSDAMNAAWEAGGRVVGVVADSLERTVTNPAMRRSVAGGRVCLITPYTPAAPFSVGNAMGRNKIIYELARCTVVVASDQDSGGTWSGATEALTHGYGHVVSWTGAGSGRGNRALVERGASDASAVDGFAELLRRPTVQRRHEDIPPMQQLTLDL
jgi:predicted Rossmann fold nucleotide-binding protein DprA/Smf involved in DNA uptake